MLVNGKEDILSMSPEELQEYIVSNGFEKYRAGQVYGWMTAGKSIGDMPNIPKALKEFLTENALYALPEVDRKYVSAIDGTIKYVFSLYDNDCVESVLMKYHHGNTLCISSQVGCRMGCRFCASTLCGKVRDLLPSEILGQVIAAQKDSGEKVSNIVMMGIGEPLDNYDNVIKFLHLVNYKKGLDIGLRHISLSTCGIVPGIRKLADEKLQITLSVSLHAYSDEKRKEIMPIANRYSIDELMNACKYYFYKTGRRISFEYTLISGKNDSKEDAEKLAELLNRKLGFTSHINLIILNEVSETGLKSASRTKAYEFMNTLNNMNQTATIRRKLGGDIDASCGQLRIERNRSI